MLNQGGGSRRAVVAVLVCLALLGSAGGCSFPFINTIESINSEPPGIHCTEERALPTIDVVLGIFEVALGTVQFTKPQTSPFGMALTLGIHTGLATLAFSSAAYGYAKTGECRDELAERARRRRLYGTRAPKLKSLPGFTDPTEDSE